MEKVNDKPRFRHGLIIGKFLPPHEGHLYLIKSAQDQVERLTVLVCTLTSEPILGALRYEWMKALCPGVEVLHHTAENPSYPHEHAEFWTIWTNSIRALVPDGPDVVFTSEAYGTPLAACLNAVHICIDQKREAFPISGSEIRENPFKHWPFLPEPVKKLYVLRVAILGAESTGKTTLAKRLAEEYQTVWVPEYGRIFVDEYQRLPRPEEMLHIAQKQIEQEDQAAGKANRVLFCDTTPLTTAIYARYYFDLNDASLWELAEQHRYDLVLLADNDIPWEADGIQRDGPAVRAALQAVFRETLSELNMPYMVISGGIEDRIQQIKPLIDALICV